MIIAGVAVIRSNAITSACISIHNSRSLNPCNNRINIEDRNREQETYQFKRRSDSIKKCTITASAYPRKKCRLRARQPGANPSRRYQTAQRRARRPTDTQLPPRRRRLYFTSLKRIFVALLAATRVPLDPPPPPLRSWRRHYK